MLAPLAISLMCAHSDVGSSVHANLHIRSLTALRLVQGVNDIELKIIGITVWDLKHCSKLVDI